jgi:hypothetical protein
VKLKMCKHCGHAVILTDPRVELVHNETGLYRCPAPHRTVAE